MDKEWEEAVGEFYGDEPDTSDTTDDEITTEEEVEDVADEEEVETTEETDDTPEDETEDKEEGSDEEAEDAPGEEDAPDETTPPETEKEVEDTPSVYDEVRRALSEMKNEEKGMSAARDEMKQDVLSMLYPEGLSKTLTDKEGNAINTIEDVMQYTNNDTGDLFTEEEAAKWLAKNQRLANEEYDEIMGNVDNIVEQNAQLASGMKAVQDNFGSILEASPELADKIASDYAKTLVFDPSGKIIVKAPVDMVGYYESVLRGYAESYAAKVKAHTESQAKKQKQTRTDRSDIPQRATPDTRKRGEEAAWDSAYNDYYQEG